MKKLLFALTILIMVTIPAALAAGNEVGLDAANTKAVASGSSLNFTGSKIDLDNEKLVVAGTASVDGWSTDGSKWKAGAPADKDIKKLLDKGGTLYLIKGLTDKKKPDAESGYVIAAFAKVDARPKANKEKLKPVYSDGDTSIYTNVQKNYWSLSKDGKVEHASVTSYEYSVGDADGKLKAEPGWQPYPTGGFAVAEAPAKGTKKTVYYLRVAPSATSAGSKTWKVAPATFGKAPKLKVDYKKEVIKLKKDTYFNGTKTAVATTTSVASLIGSAETTVEIYFGATGKKPATATQQLKIAARAAAPSVTLVVEKGKIKDPNLKLYEFSSDGNTWVKAPTVSSSNLTCKARLKANAKWKDDSFGDTKAAGITGTLTITWGDWDTEKDGVQAGIMTAVLGS